MKTELDAVDKAKYGTPPIIELSPPKTNDPVAQERRRNWLAWRAAPYPADRSSEYLRVDGDIKKTCVSAVLLLPRSLDDYFMSIPTKHRCKVRAGRAINAGYSVLKIEPRKYGSAIRDVIRSMPVRQGVLCNKLFYARESNYSFERHLPCDDPNYRSICAGVFSPEGKLGAFLLGTRVGSHVFYDEIMGHADHLKHGVMFLLHRAFLGQAMEEVVLPTYLQYGAWHSGGSELVAWKRRLQFRPAYLKLAE